MSTSSTCINDLAAESLAHIFAFLSPNERVRLERVCRKWQKVAQKNAWTELRTLTMDWRELKQEGDLALAKYRALIDRCAPHLRELNTAIVNCNVEKWARMRNLRHLRFDMCVSSGTLRAVADNLKRLQSIHFSDINWRGVAVLHDLLRINNASLQALRFPFCNSLGDSLCLPALPSSLRLLNIGCDSVYDNFYPRDDLNIVGLLELAVSCCPHLVILILNFSVNELSLAKLARFEKIIYLSLHLNPSDANLIVFGNSLATIGVKLRALSMGSVNSRVLQLVVEHCPLLEYCSFRIDCHFPHPSDAEGPLLSALQSLFQLAHLRSVFITYNCSSGLPVQILDAISGLNVRGTLEYLHLSTGLPLPAEFITNLIQTNPKLQKLGCMIRDDQTDELDKLKRLLQNMDRPLELELFYHCPPELEMGENTRVRIMRRLSEEHISDPILRQLWAREMGSVPDRPNLDD